MRGGTTEKPLLSDEYQAILTQRSIARVALHLGIDTLPSNTLTVLQDSLTQYLERVGRVLGNNVENSGRSSDHVNVLDAIRAIEDCGAQCAINSHRGSCASMHAIISSIAKRSCQMFMRATGIY